MKIKTKKCKQCKELFVVNPIFPLQYVCNYKCAIAMAKEKSQKDFTKQCKAEKKEYYDKHKKLPEYRNEARKVFQQWIRVRDFSLPCISCNKLTDDNWQGSHYYDAFKYSGLVFDERNVHKSCEQCNKFLHGNIHGYRKGLIERYGVKYVEQLESESNSKRVYKFSKQELIDIKETYKLKLKNQ